MVGHVQMTFIVNH